MKRQQKLNPPKTKFGFYNICRKIISIILTLVLLIPIVFIIGSQQTYYYNQKLFVHSSTLLSYNNKVQEIQKLLKKQSIINVHYHIGQNDNQQNDLVQWQNIRYFSQYLGYKLNSKGNLTINRVISPLQVKPSKGKNKNNQDKIQKSYEFTYFGEINILKKYLKQVLLSLFKQIKAKEQSGKQSNFITKSYIKSIKYLHKNNIWFLFINPSSNQYYQSDILVKQIKKIMKTSYSSDKFIIFSKNQDKNLKDINLSLNQSNIKQYQTNVLQSVIKQQNIQDQLRPKLQKIILCNYQDQISQFNKFIQRFSIYSDIIKKMTSKKSLKKQTLKVFKDVCRNGALQKQQNIQNLLSQFKFPQNTNKNQLFEFMSIFYQTVNNIQCQNNAKCQQKQIKLQQQTVVQQKKDEQKIKQPEKQIIIQEQIKKQPINQTIQQQQKQTITQTNNTTNNTADNKVKKNNKNKQKSNKIQQKTQSKENSNKNNKKRQNKKVNEKKKQKKEKSNNKKVEQLQVNKKLEIKQQKIQKNAEVPLQQNHNQQKLSVIQQEKIDAKQSQSNDKSQSAFSQNTVSQSKQADQQISTTNEQKDQKIQQVAPLNVNLQKQKKIIDQQSHNQQNLNSQLPQQPENVNNHLNDQVKNDINQQQHIQIQNIVQQSQQHQKLKAEENTLSQTADEHNKEEQNQNDEKNQKDLQVQNNENQNQILKQ